MTIDNMNEQQRTQWEAVQAMGRPLLIGLIVMSAILGILLLLFTIGTLIFYLSVHSYQELVWIGSIYVMIIIAEVSNIYLFNRA